MYKQGFPFKGIILGVNTILISSPKFFSNARDVNKIKMDKVLLVSKLSRFEYERNQYKHLSEKQLIDVLAKRGTDVDQLLYYHKIHKNFAEKVATTLRDMGIDIQFVNKLSYTQSKVKWADVVIPTGGDGTFLYAASKIFENTKPIIGFNSDPNRSKGFLCVPKRYSTDIKEALEILRAGQFDWLMRSRIRTTVSGKISNTIPRQLYEYDIITEPIKEKRKPTSNDECHILPVLALNEVFIGETMAARVSHLVVRQNDDVTAADLKCSGLCICTGTGSSSWHLSINRLSSETVTDILRILHPSSDSVQPSQLSVAITETYNNRLLFPPEEDRMAFSIRDVVCSEVWPNPKGVIGPKGFAKKLEVKSKCFDAYLVLDGGISFNFPDGTLATFEIHPEDALRTVVFPN